MRYFDKKLGKWVGEANGLTPEDKAELEKNSEPFSVHPSEEERKVSSAFCAKLLASCEDKEGES